MLFHILINILKALIKVPRRKASKLLKCQELDGILGKWREKLKWEKLCHVTHFQIR